MDNERDICICLVLEFTVDINNRSLVSVTLPLTEAFSAFVEVLLLNRVEIIIIH